MDDGRSPPRVRFSDQLGGDRPVDVLRHHVAERGQRSSPISRMSWFLTLADDCGTGPALHPAGRTRTTMRASMFRTASGSSTGSSTARRKRSARPAADAQPATRSRTIADALFHLQLPAPARAHLGEPLPRSARGRSRSADPWPTSPRSSAPWARRLACSDSGHARKRACSILACT